MKWIKSFGGIILNKNKVLLVYQKKKRIWGFPKGKKKGPEFGLTCAKREIWEETGIEDLKYIKKLGSYRRDTKKRGNYKKKMTLYLFKTKQTKTQSHDLKNPKAKWVNIRDIPKNLYYDKDIAFFNKIKQELN